MEAKGPIERICKECGITVKAIGGSKYLVGVRLRALQIERHAAVEAETA